MVPSNKLLYLGQYIFSKSSTSPDVSSDEVQENNHISREPHLLDSPITWSKEKVKDRARGIYPSQKKVDPQNVMEKGATENQSLSWNSHSRYSSNSSHGDNSQKSTNSVDDYIRYHNNNKCAEAGESGFSCTDSTSYVPNHYSNTFPHSVSTSPGRSCASARIGRTDSTSYVPNHSSNTFPHSVSTSPDRTESATPPSKPFQQHLSTQRINVPRPH